MQWLLIPALIMGGLIWLWRRSQKQGLTPAAMVLGFTLLSPVIALIHQHFTSLYFYYWYLSYALPLIIASVAIGLHALLAPLIRKKSVTSYTLTVIGLLSFFTLFTWQTCAWKKTARAYRKGGELAG